MSHINEQNNINVTATDLLNIIKAIDNGSEENFLNALSNFDIDSLEYEKSFQFFQSILDAIYRLGRNNLVFHLMSRWAVDTQGDGTPYLLDVAVEYFLASMDTDLDSYFLSVMRGDDRIVITPFMIGIELNRRSNSGNCQNGMIRIIAVLEDYGDKTALHALYKDAYDNNYATASVILNQLVDQRPAIGKQQWVHLFDNVPLVDITKELELGIEVEQFDSNGVPFEDQIQYPEPILLEDIPEIDELAPSPDEIQFLSTKCDFNIIGTQLNTCDVCHHDDDTSVIDDPFFNINIRNLRLITARKELDEDVQLFNLLGPVNAEPDDDFDYTSNNICAFYGGHRMLSCNCFENFEDIVDNTKLISDRSKFAWFTGQCRTCNRPIDRPCDVLRIPLINGGWIGTYCSKECIYNEEQFFSPDDTFHSAILDLVLSKLNDIGIQERERNPKTIAYLDDSYDVETLGLQSYYQANPKYTADTKLKY